jgi:hypothetical protein
MSDQDAQKLPLACNLGAMTAQQRKRHRALGEALRGQIQEILESPDGITFRLPPAAWTTATEFVSLERLCCPFVRFVLDMSENGGPIRLTLTGREGVKEFLRAELELDSLQIR